ncbi:uncharacterized protein [Palaemon carinicauda]|uniref:uncharacterized protein n=1 Tax=Palaemon carinicauda TaxID=392227 RepID=UPI0035B63BD6
MRDYSQPEQWRYVNSSDNPADVASRGISVHQFLQYDEWFHSPSFTASDYLPSQEYVCADCVHGKSEHVSVVTISEEHHGFTRLIEYISSWSRLQKAVSVFQQLKSILSGERKGCVTTDAERAIIMYVQREVFGDEVKALSRELSVGKSSPLYKLDPFLDSEDGLLKVGGRIRRSDIPQSAKHPILLPKKHHVTTLLIRHEHELLAHSGRNHALSNLRQKCWIINANATVRNVILHYVTCRKLKEPALSQKMADLPADRLEPSPPFSNVGIDLFRPYYIKEGRKELKRGHPKVIRCDNGSNFHGAERELKAALDEMEEKKIEKYLSHHYIEWKFNPPAASHMGGCCERQIRTVRKVLSALVKEFDERLNDESLRTLLCEVESIVNSRPLTTEEQKEEKRTADLKINGMELETAPVSDISNYFQYNCEVIEKLTLLFLALDHDDYARWRPLYISVLKSLPRDVKDELPGTSSILSAILFDGLVSGKRLVKAQGVAVGLVENSVAICV